MSDELDQRRIVADGDHRWTRLDDEIIFLHEDKGVYFSLNGVAIRAWELLQRPRTVDELVQILTQEYDVTSEVCRRDLLRCLRELIDHGFVKYPDGATG